MFTPAHPLYDAAVAVAQKASPMDVAAVKKHGLNRHFRRRMSSLASKGKLTASDIPVWILGALGSQIAVGS